MTAAFLYLGITALVAAAAAGVYVWLRGSYRAADELQMALWRAEKQQRSKT